LAVWISSRCRSWITAVDLSEWELWNKAFLSTLWFGWTYSTPISSGSLDICTSKGTVDESKCPFKPSLPYVEPAASSTRYKVINYVSVTGVDTMKEALMTNGHLLADIFAGKSFFEYGKSNLDKLYIPPAKAGARESSINPWTQESSLSPPGLL
jgi:hypothetical protein